MSSDGHCGGDRDDDYSTTTTTATDQLFLVRGRGGLLW